VQARELDKAIPRNAPPLRLPRLRLAMTRKGVRLISDLAKRLLYGGLNFLFSYVKINCRLSSSEEVW